MKSLSTYLSEYADYHRDPRNIATHLFGIPLIVLSILILLSRPAIELAGLPLSPAVLVMSAFVIFYLRLDLAFGVAMAAFCSAGLFLGNYLSAISTSAWLSWGIGLFFVGWVIQFIGHFYEGKKPAFFDDIMGLAVGPLFIIAEVAFLMGFKRGLEEEINHRSGPPRRNPHKAETAN